MVTGFTQSALVSLVLLLLRSHLFVPSVSPDLHRQFVSLRLDLTQVSDSVCSLTKPVFSQQSVLVKDELASIRQSLIGISSKLNSLTTSSSTSSTSTIYPPSPDNSFISSGHPPRAPPPLPPPPLCPSNNPPPWAVAGL